jgi:hypothetical protein
VKNTPRNWEMDNSAWRIISTVDHRASHALFSLYDDDGTPYPKKISLQKRRKKCYKKLLLCSFFKCVVKGYRFRSITLSKIKLEKKEKKFKDAQRHLRRIDHKI